MKVYIDTNSWSIIKQESDYPVLSGNNYVDTLTVLFNTDPTTSYFYPTLNVLKPNNRKVGPLNFDSSETYPLQTTDDDGDTWYYFEFTLASNAYVLDVTGKFQLTICINFYNSSTGAVEKQRNVNTILFVYNGYVNDDTDILILGDSVDDVVASMRTLIANLQASNISILANKADKTNVNQTITNLKVIANTFENIEDGDELKIHNKYTDSDSNVYETYVSLLNNLLKIAATLTDSNSSTTQSYVNVENNKITFVSGTTSIVLDPSTYGITITDSHWDDVSMKITPYSIKYENTNGESFHIGDGYLEFYKHALDLHNCRYISMNEASASHGTSSVNLGDSSLATGDYSITLGYDNLTSGDYSSSIGKSNTVLTDTSTAIGTSNLIQYSDSAYAFGYNNTLNSGGYVVGSSNTTSNQAGYIFGALNDTSAGAAVAVGLTNSISGAYNNVFGNNNTMSGDHSTAVGSANSSEGHQSYAFGYRNSFTGNTSGGVALGSYNSVSAATCYLLGRSLTASGSNQFIIGKHNIPDPNSIGWEVVGNGSSSLTRSNARLLDSSGNEYLAGKLYIDSTFTTDSDGNLTGVSGSEVATKSSVDTLSTEITNMKSVQNVVDTVATYADLEALDTSNIETGDKVQVIADESYTDSPTTIYNWNGSAWVYVGAYGGNSYTKTQTNALLAAIQNGTDINTFAETETALGTKANSSDVYSKSDTDDLLAAKQNTLTAGDGILINSNTISVDDDYLDGYVSVDDCENGGFNSSGLNSTTNVRIRSIKYYKVKENKTYKITNLLGNSYKISVSFYSVNDYATARISSTNGFLTNIYNVITIPSGCNYVRFLIADVDDAEIDVADISGNILSISDKEIVLNDLSENIVENLSGINNAVTKTELISLIEQGALGSAGTTTASDIRLRTSNFISVKPNQTYYVYVKKATDTIYHNIKIGAFFYLSNINYANTAITYSGFVDRISANLSSITTPSGCNYIKIYMGLDNDGTITPSDIDSVVLIPSLKITNDELSEEITIRDCYNNDSYLTSYLKSKLVSRVTFSGSDNGFVLSTAARMAAPHLFKFDYDIYAEIDSNHAISIQTFNSKSEFDLKSNSGWKTHYIIPANTYFSYVLKNVDETDVDESTYADLYFYMKKNYITGSDMIKKPIRTQYLGNIKYIQSFCYYNGKYYSTDGSNLAVQGSDFTLEQTVALSLGHGNSFQLGNSNLAYVSGWDDNNLYVVNLDTLTIDQTIALPTTGYTTCAVDELNGIVYIFQRDTQPITMEQYTLIKYDYVNSQTLSTTTLSFEFWVQQSCVFKDDKIFVMWGGSSTYYTNGFVTLNTDGKILSRMELPIFYDHEPEGASFNDDDELLISFGTLDVRKICYE